MITRRFNKNLKIPSGFQNVTNLEKISSMTKSFKTEFKKQTTVAITAAFGFLIALVWRDYIMSIIKTETISLFSALFVTAFCVLGLMAVSKWTSKADSSSIKESLK